MKLAISVPASVVFLVGLGASRVNGYVYSSQPLHRSPCTPGSRRSDCSSGNGQNFASSPRKVPRKGRFRINDSIVDRAFRDLQEELNGTYGDGVDVQFNWETMGSTKFPFEKINEETAKKWLEKAFDLASELNKDFAATPTERERTDEMIQKSRDWVVRHYESGKTKAANDGGGGDSDMNQDNFSVAPESKIQDPKDMIGGPEPSLETNDEEEVLSEIQSEEVPFSENRSNEEVFQVAVDLPGVDRTAVDVTLDGDFLVVTATRSTGSADQPVRKYKTKVAFVETEVDMDQMKATLNNGVLLISAPKHKPTEKKRKISIT